MTNNLRPLVMTALRATATPEQMLLKMPEVQAALAEIDAVSAKYEELGKMARRWRTVRRWLTVDHVFDPGRLGVPAKSIAKLAFVFHREHPLRVETPDKGTHGPTFTVEQVVDKAIRGEKN